MTSNSVRRVRGIGGKRRERERERGRVGHCHRAAAVENENDLKHMESDEDDDDAADMLPQELYSIFLPSPMPLPFLPLSFSTLRGL